MVTGEEVVLFAFVELFLFRETERKARRPPKGQVSGTKIPREYLQIRLRRQ